MRWTAERRGGYPRTLLHLGRTTLQRAGPEADPPPLVWFVADDLGIKSLHTHEWHQEDCPFQVVKLGQDAFFFKEL